jgi:hypothetical protein
MTISPEEFRRCRDNIPAAAKQVVPNQLGTDKIEVVGNRAQEFAELRKVLADATARYHAARDQRRAEANIRDLPDVRFDPASLDNILSYDQLYGPGGLLEGADRG